MAWTRIQFNAMDTPLQELRFQQMMKSDFTGPRWMHFLLVITDMVFPLLITRIILRLFSALQAHNKQLMIFYPEQTNATVSLEMKFSTAQLTKNLVFLLSEKASTIYFDSNRKVSKNVNLHLIT